MCLFSGYPEGREFHSVEKVSGTNIFARSSNGNGRQILVYSMNLASQIDLAMILPLPVPAGCPKDAVRFISLEDYSHFFRDMESGSRPGGLSLVLGRHCGCVPAEAPGSPSRRFRGVLRPDDG